MRLLTSEKIFVFLKKLFSVNRVKMGIPEKLELIIEIFISPKFKSICDAVNVFRAFLRETKPTFERAETSVQLGRSKQKLFLLNRIFEISSNKANAFRDEFVRVFNELQDIFLDILDIEDFNELTRQNEVLVDNFFLNVRKLNLLLFDFKDLKMFKFEVFKKLYLNSFDNEEEEKIVKPISLTVRHNLRYLDELLNVIRGKITDFVIEAENL